MSDQNRRTNSRPQIFLGSEEGPTPDLEEDAWIQTFIDRFLEMLKGGWR
ncbi:hypothetical protein [Bradyrhizobium sp. Gha]|nr:hypothetical protein [Bradyrhizobium sp. Gha]SFJ73105.1 hypothetical protein SAMN05216525_13376 [Bradyrhizobium sp. Gha]